MKTFSVEFIKALHILKYFYFTYNCLQREIFVSLYQLCRILLIYEFRVDLCTQFCIRNLNSNRIHQGITGKAINETRAACISCIYSLLASRKYSKHNKRFNSFSIHTITLIILLSDSSCVAYIIKILHCLKKRI